MKNFVLYLFFFYLATFAIVRAILVFTYTLLPQGKTERKCMKVKKW